MSLLCKRGRGEPKLGTRMVSWAGSLSPEERHRGSEKVLEDTRPWFFEQGMRTQSESKWTAFMGGEDEDAIV